MKMWVHGHNRRGGVANEHAAPTELEDVTVGAGVAIDMALLAELERHRRKSSKTRERHGKRETNSFATNELFLSTNGPHPSMMDSLE